MKTFIKILIIVGVIIIFIFAIYTSQKRGNERNYRHFVSFDNADINGRLESIRIAYHGVAFKIKGSNEEFFFFPFTSELNNFKIFDHIAKKGDKVIKPSQADTLKLIKNGREYLYTFEKF